MSRQVVSKLVLQREELGTLEPQVHKRGRRSAITGEKKEPLLRHFEEPPDAAVVERLEAFDLECVEETAWRMRGAWPAFQTKSSRAAEQDRHRGY